MKYTARTFKEALVKFQEALSRSEVLIENTPYTSGSVFTFEMAEASKEVPVEGVKEPPPSKSLLEQEAPVEKPAKAASAKRKKAKS